MINEEDLAGAALAGMEPDQRFRFIEQLAAKRLVGENAMPEWRKEDLYEALAELEREIDKARTRLAAVLDVVSRTLDGSETVIDAVRKIVTIIQEAKVTEREKAKLEAPVQPKRIEASKRKEIAPPKPKIKTASTKNWTTRFRFSLAVNDP